MRPLIILITLILASCGNRTDTANTVDTVSIQKKFVDTITNIHSDELIGNSAIVWQIGLENKTKKKNPNFKKDHLNIDSIIKGLNEIFPNIKLERKNFSHDTLYTEIKDSYYLCESMGTSGATFYLSKTVINLTSVKDVRFVKIDFAEGSHASPGIWNKEDFNDYKEIK